MTTPAPSSTSGSDIKKLQRHYSPQHTLILLLIGIAVAEVIAMIVVFYFRAWPYYQQVVLDAVVMTTIIFPLLYFQSTRPLLQYIEQQKQTESILQARLRLIEYAHTHSMDELLQETLDEVERITGSQIGFFHFLEMDEKSLWLRAWSTNTLQNMCTLESKDSHYDVDQAGVWADCVRERRPVIHNDYAVLPHRRGLPEGHASVKREMAVPIIENGKVVAILGMGNKAENYTATDVEIVVTFADFAWDIVRDKQAELALRESEQKFRTLVDWTYDWELWLDPQGTVVYNSPSCERLTGYSPADFSNQPDLIQQVVHPEDRLLLEEHRQILHSAESGGTEKMEYRIVARDGSERWVEHVCRPLFGSDHRYLGRRISNRDITERKQAEKEIDERNQKEKQLTQTIHTIQLDIARDLHDTIGQNIGFLRMKLDYLFTKKSVKPTEMKSEIKSMMAAANETYDLMRGTLAILQSIDSTGLPRLFNRYAAQVEERSALKVDFSTCGEVRSLSPQRMRQLFYVFREIMSNIEKHASATEVHIEMTWDLNSLSLLVADNGTGFDISQPHAFGGHYGLKFMKERVDLLNGSVTIQSASDTGTRVIVQIPYESY